MGQTRSSRGADERIALHSLLGHAFDENASVIIPEHPEHLESLWCFCSSAAFAPSIRAFDNSIKVTCGSLVKIPFDLAYWQSVVAESYPNGLPDPHSADPTQWLFKGHVNGSADPLQVAVARLLGYRWPDQEPDSLDALADADGIVPIPAVRSDDPAAGGLREVLRIAFGSEWSASMEHRLRPPDPGTGRVAGRTSYLLAETGFERSLSERAR